jgi:hypothetical protein
MLDINGAWLAALGELSEQLSRAWAVDAAALDRLTCREPEAGQ